MDAYGTDALRIALVVGNTPGTSLALDENRIRGYKNFANKIWNASKFVLMNIEDYKASKKPSLSSKQKKYLSDLKKITKEVTKLMEELKFYYAAEKIYHYFWHEFCDKIIEESKQYLKPEADQKIKQGTQYMLLEILNASLKLLHPFMPFITEEIYQQLPIKDKKECLMIEEWPS